MTWTTAALGEIAASVDYGLTASATQLPAGPKFLRITDIQNDHVDWDSVPFCQATKSEEAANSLAPGDIVFARTGATTGKSFLLRSCPERAVFASYLIRVRPSDQIDATYLAKFFQSDNYWAQIRQSARGAAQPGVNSTVLKELVVPFPSLDEQRRIAAILDQADDLRRKRREALEQFDRFTTTLFDVLANDAQGTREVGLGEVCRFVSGNSLPVGIPFTGQVNGCLLLKVSDLGAGANDPIVWQAKEWIESPPRSHASLVAPAFSVVFPKRGGAIATNKKRRLGRAAILDPNLMAVAVEKPERLHPIFLSQWFAALDLVSISSGSAVPQLNKRDLDRLTIQLPTIDAQRTFATHVAEIDKLRGYHHAHLAKLDTLCASLQHRAFRGDL
jgi:type I restriction enzyme S subunit